MSHPAVNPGQGVLAVEPLPLRLQAESLGGNKCTYGPSYWCRDVATAKACNTLEHCQQNVW
jgi:hypothetical protein